MIAHNPPDLEVNMMNELSPREHFDTGLRKIRTEIKTRLVPHGLFGTITDVDSNSGDSVLSGSRIDIVINGRTASRSFDRQQIEDCRLRVGGPVLMGIISMVEELSA
jgi:hypothetical protein